MNQEYTVKKIKKDYYRHTFKDSFIEELINCDYKIQSDFFAIWKSFCKNKHGIDVQVSYGDNLINCEEMIIKTDQWVNRIQDIGMFKAYNLILDGLSKNNSVRNPSELLKVMKILYKCFE